MLDDFDEVVQGLLVDFDEVAHFELVEEVLEEVHRVEVVLDLLQLVLVEVVQDLVDVLDEVQGFEEVDEVVQGLVELLEEVHGLVDEEVVHGLLDVVDLLGVEHEVEVRVVAGVQVKVLQLVVVVGFPAVVMRYTSQCLEVVVAGRHSLPDSHTAVGQTGPVS